MFSLRNANPADKTASVPFSCLHLQIKNKWRQMKRPQVMVDMEESFASVNPTKDASLGTLENIPNMT